MGTTSCLALLRGINVGGRNKVPMADLRLAFEEAGHREVRTYIQSGNVLFTTDGPIVGLDESIEAVLEARYGVSLVVVVRTGRQLRTVVDDRPAGFGDHPDRFHSDVIFLRRPLTAARAMSVVSLREGVDRAWTGTDVLYFERLSAERTRSRMSSIVGTPEYASMTIRNWNTTTKLVAMLDRPD